MPDTPVEVVRGFTHVIEAVREHVASVDELEAAIDLVAAAIRDMAEGGDQPAPRYDRFVAERGPYAAVNVVLIADAIVVREVKNV